jgi:hypothetical protein
MEEFYPEPLIPGFHMLRPSQDPTIRSLGIFGEPVKLEEIRQLGTLRLEAKKRGGRLRRFRFLSMALND